MYTVLLSQQLNGMGLYNKDLLYLVTPRQATSAAERSASVV